MGRIARVVIPGCPDHIIQPGIAAVKMLSSMKMIRNYISRSSTITVAKNRQEKEREEGLDMFRNQERTGRPLVCNKFIISIGQLTGRRLRKQGPVKTKKK